MFLIADEAHRAPPGIKYTYVIFRRTLKSVGVVQAARCEAARRHVALASNINAH